VVTHQLSAVSRARDREKDQRSTANQQLNQTNKRRTCIKGGFEPDMKKTVMDGESVTMNMNCYE